MVIVVMGVSGSGKSTVGRLLAETLGWRFIDGDDHHPPENVAKMAAGIPLDEEDRAPWLARLAAILRTELLDGRDVVLACSALTERSRALLRVDPAVRFVHLAASPEVLAPRLAARRGHFMPASLLASQYATLEPPTDAVTLDAGLDPQALVAEIRRALSLGG